MKLLINGLVISLVSLSFIGCKSSSGNKVTTHRGGKDVNTNGKTGPGGNGNNSKSGSNTSIDTAPGKDQNETVIGCDTSTPEGWESHVITNRSTPQNSNDQMKIHYLVPKNISFDNPVLVLTHQLGTVSNEKAEKILSLGKEKQFDPIIMDVRGTGCSMSLPSDKKQWNEFSAEKSAEDAERIRKEVLKDKKWKIWSFQNSSLIALKMVEKFPTTITSLQLVDFAIGKTQLDLEKNRLSTQIEAWKKFKEFSKENEFELTAEVETKINQTLKEKGQCSDTQKICKLDLMTSLIQNISGDDSEWKKAIESLKLLSEGEISDELVQIAQMNQKKYLYNQFLITAHLDSDSNRAACELALNDKELIKQAEVTPIKSCSIERAMFNTYASELKGKIQHKKMNYELIQKNIKAQKIDLILVNSERSLMSPMTATGDTLKMLTGESNDDSLLTPDSDTEIFFYEQLLDTLK